MALLFREIGGTGRPDKQTDGRGATLNAASWEGGPHSNRRIKFMNTPMELCFLLQSL